MTNFISKEEAVKIVEGKLLQREQEETDYLFKAIRQAAERGEYEVTVYAAIAENNLEILLKLGYTIVNCEYDRYKQVCW